MSAVIVLHDVMHEFPGAEPLFTGLTLALQAGEVYALTGPSGSGKSTLLSIIAGWLTPTSGVVRREGVQSLAWVAQNPHGVARRTALDHVALPYLARGATRHDAEPLARSQLAAFGLADVAEREFRQLSGGEAQRLMLARGMACEPDLLLVDEPTAQLDRRTAALVNRSMHALRSAETIVVVATHDLATRDACTAQIDLGSFR